MNYLEDKIVKKEYKDNMIAEKTMSEPNVLFNNLRREVLEKTIVKNDSILNLPFEVLAFDKGEYVYHENDEAKGLYYVEKGSVKIAKMDKHGEIVKSIISNDSYFGETVLCGETVRNEFAQTITSDTLIKFIDSSLIQREAESNPVISKEIIKILGGKMSQMERRLESIISKDSRTRIIDFLKDLAIDSGKKVGFETLIKNNFTHKDIASLTGTSRQTVTTTLNHLKEQNIINFDRRRILIRDLNLLV
jgi:CRP-like cAMP-binding protein